MDGWTNGWTDRQPDILLVLFFWRTLTNTQSFCKPRRYPAQMERHLEKGKRNFVGWEFKHSLLLSWNLRPPMYYSAPNLFKQPWFNIPRIWTVSWVLRLRSLDMHFLFRARFLHQFNNFFHLHLFYSCEIMGPSVKKRTQAEKGGRVSVWKGVEFCSITVMSPLIPVQKYPWDDRDYSPNPGTWRLIQTPTLEGSHIKMKARDSLQWRKSLPHDMWPLNREARTTLQSAKSLQSDGTILTSLRPLGGGILQCCLPPTLPLCFSQLHVFKQSFLHQTFNGPPTMC